MHRLQSTFCLVAVLCRILLGTGLAGAQEASAPFLTRPDIHGDRIMFTAEGGLWLASLSGGAAQRITTHPGVETTAHFSPDGAHLAFIASYDGSRDVYIMPVAGGEPERLTYDPLAYEVQGWTPDGKNVLYNTVNRQNPRQVQLKTVPACGGMPQTLPVPAAAFAALNPDGHRLAYVPTSAVWQHWFHYRGGQADKVWLTDLTTHSFKRLIDDPGVETTPVWAGDTLYFVSERSGIANLYRLDTRKRQGGYPLIDGGTIDIPNYGAWEPDPQGKPGRWIIEGTDSEPGIPVEQDPASVLAGRDPQLDRAISYLKDQLAKNPIVRPIPPPHPNKAVKPAASTRQ